MNEAAAAATTAVVVGLALLAAGVALRRWRGRSLLTPTFFVVGAACLAYAGFRAATNHPRALGFGLVVLAALLAVAVAALAVFLVANGVLVRHRESTGLANSLSLLLGLVLLAAPVLIASVLGLRTPVAFVLGAGLAFLLGYAGVAFVVFVVYALVQGSRTRPDQPAGTIVVLGSKILGGEVPPLLRSRLDRALELYYDAQDRGAPTPLLVPSGGRGPDESRSESAAMAEYLLTHGAAAADVRLEDRSTTTRENLLRSVEVQHGVGRDGRLVVVTNGYHVLRASLHAQRLGLDADVVGAPTAAYYVPSAVIREFVATLVDQRRLHAALLALPTLAFGTLLVLALVTG